MTNEEAKHFYENHWVNPVGEMNWKYVADDIFKDHSIFVSQRLSKEKEFLLQPKLIENCFAAELFADESPPRLLVAESIFDTHKELRTNNPSTAPRLSGDLIKLKMFPFKFFQLDAVLGDTHALPTNIKLEQVSNWLLSQDIIPLDARMEIINFKTN